MVAKPELNAHSATPLYQQLHRYFSDLIRSGRLAAGERLPATRELAGMLGLNRTTVSAAYELLESEGLISGHVGRGSFVTTGRRNAGALDWKSFLGSRSDGPLLPPVASRGADLISFASSRPAQELFPLEAFRASCREVLESPLLPSILQLGSPGGYEPLRHHLLQIAREHHLAGPDDDLVITNGCQQALDLIGRLLVRSGDKVIIEDPVYPGLKNVMAQSGAQLIGVPVGADGMDLEILEQVIRRERPRLVLVTSNFQNPTGATLPADARKTILRLASEAGMALVENDLYGELRYQGESVPCLKQMDATGHTILLRSFSKITFPGLRVGWVIAPRPVVQRLTEAKHLSDLHTDQFSQAVLLRFLQSGRLEAHRRRMLETGAERLQAVLGACERHLPRGTHFTRPQGGMNLWVTLPEPLDSGELLARAQRENVTYLPAKYFAVSRNLQGGLRLSFAGLSPEKIWKGVATLGQLFAGELERSQSRPVEPELAVV